MQLTRRSPRLMAVVTFVACVGTAATPGAIAPADPPAAGCESRSVARGPELDGIRWSVAVRATDGIRWQMVMPVVDGSVAGVG